LRKHVDVDDAIVAKRFMQMNSFAREKEKATNKKKKKSVWRMYFTKHYYKDTFKKEYV
jgi:hypothetical protein